MKNEDGKRQGKVLVLRLKQIKEDGQPNFVRDLQPSLDSKLPQYLPIHQMPYIYLHYSTFYSLKKKKKKLVQTDILEEEAENMGDDLDDPVAEEEGEGIVLQQQQRLPWEGSDRDYEYDELLGRVFGFLQNYASGARALVAKVQTHSFLRRTISSFSD
ncbi:hypothetical protein LguiB_021539 [Lonicera macranthoides]